MISNHESESAGGIGSSVLLGRTGKLKVEDAIVPVKIIAVDETKKCPKCSGAWGTTITTEQAMLGCKRILIKGTTGDGCLNDVRLDKQKLCHTWNGQLLAHPFHMAIYEVMGEIEKLPASEQETKIMIMAGALQNRVAEMRAEASKQAKCLRDQAVECFPEESGQKHFVRLIMEGVADELDAAFNPPNDKVQP